MRVQVIWSLFDLFLDHKVEHDRHPVVGVARVAVLVLVLAGVGPVAGVEVELDGLVWAVVFWAVLGVVVRLAVEVG